MKNEIFKQSNLDSNMLIAAVKKANENLNAAANPIAQAPKDDLVNPDTKVSVNPQKSKLDQVERLLNAADRSYFSTKRQEDKGVGTNGSTPRLSKIQREEYMTSENASEAIPGDKFGSYLSSNWDGEYLSAEKKRGYLDAEETGDEWRSSNPLRAGGVLANNGAKTRMSTDAPPSLWARIKSYQAEEHLDEYLRSIGVDTDNLSLDQKFLVDKGVKELNEMANEGSLSDVMEDTVVWEVANKIATTTNSPTGGTYAVTMVPDKVRIKSLPQPGYTQTPGLSNEVMKAVREYGIDQSVKYQILRAQIAYTEASRKSGNPVDFLPYYEKMNQEIYEKIAKPVTYTTTNNSGKSITVTGKISDLISPNDNSFGAQFAREVLRLTGLDRLHKAKELVQGENGEYEIDCSRLVCWGLSQMDPKWKVDTISTAARYQIDDFPVVWPKRENEPIDYAKLKPGDTLFWQGVDSGEIVHTAIYLGNEMMIETMNTVQIVKVREYTHGGDREDSQLVQINRMTPEGLNDNYEKNTN